MILSNVEIAKCLRNSSFAINGLAGNDPGKAPFNTSAVDLRLGNIIQVPTAEAIPAQLDLRRPGIAKFFAQHSRKYTLTEEQPFSLEPHKLILANTLEIVDFPLQPNEEGHCYSARVEGKSSLARCGILVHFTAPTIHAGFSGTITLEIINMGVFGFLLTPEMFICQLIIEEVKGLPAEAPNQFKGQSTPAGV